MKNNRAWKLSMASLIMGIIHFAVNLPWAAAILLWGDADVHGGLGLFENSRIMDLLASLSFFLGILFVWVVFAVLSVVFGCLVLRKEPDKKIRRMAAAGIALNLLGFAAHAVYMSAWAQFGGV